MPLTREKALEQLQAWTKNPSLLTHARSVEIVMRAAAGEYGGDPDQWALTGLIHDADYDQWPEDHPRRIVAWLREQGEEDIAYAVSFHQTAWGLPPKTQLDKGLLACDELDRFCYRLLPRPARRYFLAGAQEREEKTQGQGIRRQGRSGDRQEQHRATGRGPGRPHSVRDPGPETPCPGAGDCREGSGVSSPRSTVTSRGASMPRRILSPRISTTVTLMPSPMTMASL